MLLRKKYAKGFTMIEIIIVISIIAILTAIAVPNYLGYVKEAKATVCRVNCVQIEKMYEMYLEIEGIEHTDVGFEEFVRDNGMDICPEHGVITYVDGMLKCSVHVGEDDSEGDGDVPYL